MSKITKTFAGLLGIAILLLGGILGSSLLQKRQWTSVQNDEPKFRLAYHRQMKIERISDEQKQTGEPFLRLTEGTLSNPFLLSVRLETGLRLVSSLTRQDIIPMLIGNAEKAFPERFKEYHKESEREFEQGGKKAAEIIFIYQGPSGEQIKQRFLMIAYDGNTALYFAAQAKASDFDAVDKKYFNKMLTSLTFE